MTHAIVKKNGRERIEVSISEFKKRKFLDIRNFYNDDGEWKPTPKGISIPVELAHEIYRAVKKVGKPFFDLLPPPGKEQEADEEINEKKAKSAKADSGIQRRKKTVSVPEHDDDEMFEEEHSNVKRIKSKKGSKEIKKMIKQIGKKVAADMLEKIDAKIAKDGKKKKSKLKAAEPEKKSKVKRREKESTSSDAKGKVYKRPR